MITLTYITRTLLQQGTLDANALIAIVICDLIGMTYILVTGISATAKDAENWRAYCRILESEDKKGWKSLPDNMINLRARAMLVIIMVAAWPIIALIIFIKKSINAVDSL